MGGCQQKETIGGTAFLLFSDLESRLLEQLPAEPNRKTQAKELKET